MAKDTGIASMQIARVFLKTKNRREIGDKLARRIEEGAGLEPNWLDQDHAKADDLVARISSLDLQSRQAIEGLVDAMLLKTSSEDFQADLEQD